LQPHYDQQLCDLQDLQDSNEHLKGYAQDTSKIYLVFHIKVRLLLPDLTENWNIWAQILVEFLDIKFHQNMKYHYKSEAAVIITALTMKAAPVEIGLAGGKFYTPLPLYSFPFKLK
jgi:hypothetical protein